MKRKLLTWCREQDLFSPGDRVILAVSGGADSMVMAHFLCAMQEPWDLHLRCAHLNHQLRGQESDRDEAFVRSFCQRRGIDFICRRQDAARYASQTGQGLEAAARSLRYEFFSSIDPDAKIATAHTASDNFETVLMHLIRGASLQGLCGIAPKRGRIVRPVLPLTKADILQYAQENQVAYVTDSTNREDFCLRNRLRNHVVPALLQENPQAERLVLGQSLRLRQDAQVLTRQAQDALQAAKVDLTGHGHIWPAPQEAGSARVQQRTDLPDLGPALPIEDQPKSSNREDERVQQEASEELGSALYTADRPGPDNGPQTADRTGADHIRQRAGCGELGSGLQMAGCQGTGHVRQETGGGLGPALSVSVLQAFPHSALLRVLGLWLGGAGIEGVTASHLEAAARLISGAGNGQCAVPGGLVVRDYDVVLLNPAPAFSYGPVPLAIPGSAPVPGTDWRLDCHLTVKTDFDRNTPYSFFLKYDMIRTDCSLRSRKSGDTLHLSGGTKTVKKLLIDRKVPRYLRDRLPVLTAGGRLCAVAGIGADPAFLAECGDQAVHFTLQRG